MSQRMEGRYVRTVGTDSGGNLVKNLNLLLNFCATGSARFCRGFVRSKFLGYYKISRRLLGPIAHFG
jgi:hypothetical protein